MQLQERVNLIQNELADVDLRLEECALTKQLTEDTEFEAGSHIDIGGSLPRIRRLVGAKLEFMAMLVASFERMPGMECLWSFESPEHFEEYVSNTYFDHHSEDAFSQLHIQWDFG